MVGRARAESVEFGSVLKRKMSWREILSVNRRFPLSRLLALARPQWRMLALGTVFLFVGSAAGLAFPQAMRFIMDGAFTERSPELVDQAAAAMLVIFLVQGVAIAGRSYLFTVVGERIVTNLRKTVYSRILDQEVAFFDSRRTGELISRLASDTGVLQNTVSVNISMALRHSLMTLGGIGLLLWTSPKLTGLMLLVVPPVAIGAVTFGRRIRRFSRGVHDALAKASEAAEESISGIRTVRAFTAEDRERDRYGGAVETAFELARQRSALSAGFIGVTSFAGYSAVAIVLWMGGHQVLDGEMTVGDLTSFVLYTLTVAFALGALGGLWVDFMRAVGAGERVFEIMDRDPAIHNKEGLQPDDMAGEVCFERVNFTYPARPDIQVLHDVELEVATGEVIALVGPSGGGKSTVAALLQRLYDPDEGRVLVDGLDVCDISPDWLRQRIGVVAQEPTLFSATVAENILYGRPDAGRSAVEAAAKAANAAEFIAGFPEGYDTEVGERGVQLSGGQKQRVAIARAVLKDPRILLLDEATSALDAESEHLVKDALERLMKGRTTLIIAHRLSTVKDADRVAVVDGGRVVESGPHEELVKKDGLYRRLVERQLA